MYAAQKLTDPMPFVRIMLFAYRTKGILIKFITIFLFCFSYIFVFSCPVGMNFNTSDYTCLKGNPPLRDKLRERIFSRLIFPECR